MSAAHTGAAGSSQGGRFAQFIDWVDERFPLTAMMKEHVTEYYAAKNFNAWYVFGVLALLAQVVDFLMGHGWSPEWPPSC